MATATIGIFATAGSDPALQTALGLATYGLAAERAAVGDPGPGTFRARLLDEVAALHATGTSGVNIVVSRETARRLDG
jgi:hydroxyethylthiazole kinase-like sugar kinase family protein